MQLIKEGEFEAEHQSLTGFFTNVFKEPDKIAIQQIESFLPNDDIETRVKTTEGQFKPIKQGSLGEKCTAVLALLLASSEQPLIIDQPEEDLDNKYVYEVVVDLLRGQKFNRQIIAASHNANIPVNGDAEQIISLEVEDRMCSVSNSGSIDREEIKNDVSVIMEGSEEAFRLRRERYGF